MKNINRDSKNEKHVFNYQIPDSKELAEKVARATIQELGKQLVKNNDSRRLIRQYRRLTQVKKEG